MQRPIATATQTGGLYPAPLRYPDFRALWLAAIASGSAFLGERIVVGWFLLEATDSPFSVGLGLALAMVPNLLLGVPAGVLADRLDRRVLMRTSGFGAALNVAVLGGLGLAGLLEVWQVLLLSFVGGCLRTLGSPARQTYAFDIVGASQVVSAMAMLNLGQRFGGIVGSLAIGAVLGAWGVGAAFLTIASAYAASGVVIFWARSRGQAAPASNRLQPFWSGFGEYAGELTRNRTLALLIFLTASVEVLGFSFQALLPSIARDRLDTGAGGLGFLNAMTAFGGLASVAFITLRGDLAHKGIAFLIVLQAFGLAMIALGQGSTIVLAAAACFLVANLAAMSDLLTQSLVQSAVPNELRGRAMGSWSLAIGVGPLGTLQIGALAAAAGITVALTANGLVLLTLGIASLVLSKRLRGL
jgi:MFS family permease